MYNTLWYDKAMEELENELADGELTFQEYRRYVRDLEAELDDYFDDREYENRSM